MTQFHRDAQTGDIHQIHQWAYADATAKAAATGFVSSDVGKVALQIDTAAYYILTATTPTWQKIGNVGTTDTQTLTNKALSDSTTTIVDVADATKAIGFDAGGTASTKTSITGAQTGYRVVTLPDATTTLVGTDATQTLSAKTFSDPITLTEVTSPSAPASTKRKLYTKSDGKIYHMGSDGVETLVGSGSGGGGLNLLTLDSAYAVNNGNDADAESTLGRWTTYADAAGTIPVDMTAGTPGSTVARSTSSPLNGTASILFDLGSGSSRQGEGVVLGPVYVPPGYRGRQHRFSLVFSATGALVDGDIVPYAYDITNSALIAATFVQSKLLGASGKFVANFDIPSTCAQLRIGLHVARTSTAALSIKFDDVKLTDEVTPTGVSGENWNANRVFTYGPGFGTVSAPNTSIVTQMLAGCLKVRGYIRSGTVAASQLYITLPAGMVVDTSASKLPMPTSNRNKVGTYSTIGTSATPATSTTRVVFIDGANPSNIYFGYQDVSNGYSTVNGNTLLNSGDSIAFECEIPIAGADANVTLGASSKFSISSYLASGSRVTGSAPTALGQYRSYLRNASATTFTETNGAPSTTPSASNGIAIWQGQPWATAGVSGNPTRYDIFVGLNKNVRVDAYASTGRTGAIDTTTSVLSSTVNVGYAKHYDPSTGILTITATNANGSGTTHVVGIDPTTGSMSSATLLYFDITVSENALAVGMDRSFFTKQVAIGSLLTGTSSRTSTTYGAFGTDVNLTFTATNSAKYRVYFEGECDINSLGATGGLKIVNTVGGATQNYKGEMIYNEPVSGYGGHVRCFGIFTLAAGVSYTFQLQAKASAGTLSIDGGNSESGFAIIAEQIE